MLSVILLNVIMLVVVMMSVVMLSAVNINVFMLSVGTSAGGQMSVKRNLTLSQRCAEKCLKTLSYVIFHLEMIIFQSDVALEESISSHS
jgi:hypothetical protein